MIVQQALRDIPHWISHVKQKAVNDNLKNNKPSNSVNKDGIRLIRGTAMQKAMMTVPKFSVKEALLHNYMQERIKTESEDKILNTLPDKFHLPYPAVLLEMELANTNRYMGIYDSAYLYILIATGPVVQKLYNSPVKYEGPPYYLIDGLFYSPPKQTGHRYGGFTSCISDATIFAGDANIKSEFFDGVGKDKGHRLYSASMQGVKPGMSLAIEPEEMEDLCFEMGMMIASWNIANALLLSQSVTKHRQKPKAKTQSILRKERIPVSGWEYHELKIGKTGGFKEVPAEYCPTREHQGGTHASPREHERRGHFRTLHRSTPKERKVWIEPLTVCKDSPRGRIDKDYVIGGDKKESSSPTQKPTPAPYDVSTYYKKNPYTEDEPV